MKNLQSQQQSGTSAPPASGTSTAPAEAPSSTANAAVAEPSSSVAGRRPASERSAAESDADLVNSQHLQVIAFL